MLEDFTHVVPEDKEVPAGRTRFKDQVFDLNAANERARYFQQLRKELEAAERISQEKFKELLNSQNNSCNL